MSLADIIVFAIAFLWFLALIPTSIVSYNLSLFINSNNKVDQIIGWGSLVHIIFSFLIICAGMTIIPYINCGQIIGCPIVP